LLAVLGALTFLLLLPAPAHAAAPVHCRIGAYVVSLRDFNVSDGSFTAELWLWSTCPSKKLQPIKTLEFVNANEVTTSHYAASRVNGVYWAEEKVTGTFRYNWDLGDYPFDRHTLELQIEDTFSPVGELVFDPDVEGSKVSNDLSLNGWRVAKLHIEHLAHRSNTSFGYPGESPVEGETYSQIRIKISLTRADYSRLLLFTIVPFLAVILVFAGRLLPAEATDVRMDLATAGLFAVVISLLAVTDVLGTVLGDSLVGEVHVVALLYILIVALMNILDRRRELQGAEEAVLERTDIRSLVLLAVTYVIVNGVVFANALFSR
jgi:hypothetical protein